MLAGGIKGIRALRVQRDLLGELNSTIKPSDPTEVEGANRFAKYEESKN